MITSELAAHFSKSRGRRRRQPSPAASPLLEKANDPTQTSHVASVADSNGRVAKNESALGSDTSSSSAGFLFDFDLKEPNRVLPGAEAGCGFAFDFNLPTPAQQTTPHAPDDCKKKRRRAKKKKKKKSPQSKNEQLCEENRCEEECIRELKEKLPEESDRIGDATKTCQQQSQPQHIGGGSTMIPTLEYSADVSEFRALWTKSLDFRSSMPTSTGENRNAESRDAWPVKSRPIKSADGQAVGSKPDAITKADECPQDGTFRFAPTADRTVAMINRQSMVLHRQNRLQQQMHCIREVSPRSGNMQSGRDSDESYNDSTRSNGGAQVPYSSNNPFTFGFNIFGDGILAPAPSNGL